MSICSTTFINSSLISSKCIKFQDCLSTKVVDFIGINRYSRSILHQISIFQNIYFRCWVALSGTDEFNSIARTQNTWAREVRDGISGNSNTYIYIYMFLKVAVLLMTQVIFVDIEQLIYQFDILRRCQLFQKTMQDPYILLKRSLQFICLGLHTTNTTSSIEESEATMTYISSIIHDILTLISTAAWISGTR